MQKYFISSHALVHYIVHMTHSSSLNKEKILDALSQVTLADSNQDVVSAGLISGVTVFGARVGFLLEGDASREALRQQCEGVVQTLPNVEQVTAVLTAHSDAPSEPRKQAAWNHQPIEGVKQVVAIASGKGGVGKSSIAVLLALALARQGQSVGLLDADIYGPSIPTMLGVDEQAEVKDNRLIPQLAHGISAMSMGMLIGDQAAVMRAPRVTKALQQMLRQTDWTHHSAHPTCDNLNNTPPACGGGRGGAVPRTGSIDGSSRVAVPPPAAPPRAGEMDIVLHEERTGGGDAGSTNAAGLPDGTMVTYRDAPHLVVSRSLRKWSWSGYGPAQVFPDGSVDMITSPSIVAVLRAGFTPSLHISARLVSP